MRTSSGRVNATHSIRHLLLDPQLLVDVGFVDVEFYDEEGEPLTMHAWRLITIAHR
jgi:hypothetical protein